MKNKEIWKDIEGYDGMYQVSDKGRVKSIGYGKERIMKPVKIGRGYLKVGLWKNGFQKWYFIHRLVAQTFLPNPQKLNQINHKDEDKTNNSVENLEWCTAKYNINYGSHNQRSGEKRSKPVLQYTKDGKFVKEWKSLMDVQRNLGYFCGHISYCCLEKSKSAYGFIWCYKKILDPKLKTFFKK